MWILKNSTSLLSSLDQLDVRTAKSVQTFDFSTLYTSIPHDLLKSRISNLVHNAFRKKDGSVRYTHIKLTRAKGYLKSLGHSIINMYSVGACSALGITNQDALSEDLENDPFLNSALQRFTWELYYRFGSFLAPLSVGIITSRHYLLSEHNKNGE